MPRGPGKASNYNLDYSRFNGVKPDEAEAPLQAKEEVEEPPPSDIPHIQDILRRAPPELQEAYYLLVQGRANGDAAAERRANELVLKAMQKASPEVQREFVVEMSKRAPEAASAISAAVSGIPAQGPGLADLGATIDVLRQQMESGAEAARRQMENLQKQQEQLERLQSPEEFFKYMHEQGGMTEQDLQRIFGGDQQHMEKCMLGMLDKAASGGDQAKAVDSEKALQAAEHIHATLLGQAPPQPPAAAGPVDAGQTAPAATPAVAAPARPKEEEEVKIPDHRLQYEKDADGRYAAVKLRCTMPGVADMSAIMLDVSEKHIRLSTCAPAPRYAVNAGPFPVLIDPSAARAKYSRRREELSVEVPAKADA